MPWLNGEPTRAGAIGMVNNPVADGEAGCRSALADANNATTLKCN